MNVEGFLAAVSAVAVSWLSTEMIVSAVVLVKALCFCVHVLQFVPSRLD